MPIARLKSRALSHYEALLRLPATADASSHSARHVSALLTIAEDTALIDLIDVAILDQVATMLRERPDVHIALNVSVMTLQNGLPNYLSACFRHLDVLPRMIFEITESKPIEQAPALEQFIDVMRKAAGSKIALDDLGAGFFHPSDIAWLRPDYVKLSQEVVYALCDKPSAQHRRQAEIIIDEALQIGARLIAEHVDEPAMVPRLIAAGVEYGQGYLIGQPVEVMQYDAAAEFA